MKLYLQFRSAFSAVMILTFFLSVSAFALTIYDDGGIHNIDTIMPVGTVYLDNATTANVLSGGSVTGGTGAGMVFGIVSTNGSTVNVFDGAVAGGSGYYACGIVVDYGSTAAVYGGHIAGGTSSTWAEGIDIGYGAIVAIHGGDIRGGNGQLAFGVGIIGGDLVSSLTIYDGSITGGSGEWAIGIGTMCNSTVNIYDGTIAAGTGDVAAGMIATDNSVVNIFGGSIAGGNGLSRASALSAEDTSAVNIYGGSFAPGTGQSAWGIAALGNSTITIYGSGFNYGFGSVSDSSGILTGMLSDGTPFNTSFEQQYAGQILLSPIPEPATLLFFALGALTLRKKP